eukprot:2613612-Pleurochrysis_carterae.AAC.5
MQRRFAVLESNYITFYDSKEQALSGAHPCAFYVSSNPLYIYLLRNVHQFCLAADQTSDNRQFGFRCKTAEVLCERKRPQSRTPSLTQSNRLLSRSKVPRSLSNAV